MIIPMIQFNTIKNRWVRQIKRKRLLRIWQD